MSAEFVSASTHGDVEWACSNPHDCVEVGIDAQDPKTVLVRDSKDPEGPTLQFTHQELAGFVLGAAAGEFNHLVDPSLIEKEATRAEFEAFVGRLGVGDIDVVDYESVPALG